jgi:RNA 3'-phosphate cyclase
MRLRIPQPAPGGPCAGPDGRGRRGAGCGRRDALLDARPDSGTAAQHGIGMGPGAARRRGGSGAGAGPREPAVAGAVASISAPGLAAPLIELDGAQGEGGGQIVRTALFLAILLDRPVRIRRIRAGRAKPGLKPQHASILRLLERMTGSAAEGGEVGSQELAFRPGRPRAGTWELDIGTGGAVSLLLQAVLPVAIATPGTTRLVVTGGTDVPFSPTIDWLRLAYLPYVAPLARIGLQVERRGFAERGGGRVALEVEQPVADADTVDGLRRHVAAALGARRIQRGPPRACGVRSLASAGLGRSVAQRQAFAALAHLTGLGTPQVEIEEVEADSPGSSVTCWAEDAHGNRLGSDRLGHRAARAEDVGRIAATNLLEDWAAGATVDRHLADFVVPWVALGAGAVRIPHPTRHLETNAWVCREMLGPWAVRIDRNLVR